jgi:3-deoxy-D-manno-octulosonate 8-phosphate phosphatase (KDO 8-P phosphatase)
VLYCGDDIPDITAMEVVGLAVAPADAAHEVKDMAGYITEAAGGYGVAREVLEQILRAKGMWMSDSKAFGW